jgi:hypothetical protein
MKVANHTEQELLIKVQERVNELEQRERIVIKLPFASKLTRVEIYCSETQPNSNSAGQAISGKQFEGVLKISVFNDYGNKPIETSSYTYVKEFNQYLPTLISKLYQFAAIAA